MSLITLNIGFCNRPFWPTNKVRQEARADRIQNAVDCYYEILHARGYGERIAAEITSASAHAMLSSDEMLIAVHIESEMVLAKSAGQSGLPFVTPAAAATMDSQDPSQ